MPTSSRRHPQHAITLLTRAERLLARRVRAVLDAEGHSLDAWRVLSLLADGAGHHMTEIADHAFLPPATLTKLVDQLVDQNLVHRRIDPLDRRRIRAYLTPRGEQLCRRIDAAVRASWAGLPVGESDQELLTELLTRLVDALEAEPATPTR
ncbi:MarR family winged helix-turn-helix transcriptional regulator [Allostreptomyces psammosilenae]|uniref:DNA-binding MarR family transcriptional regulator n=1 Tax=Allostreptomyces psammosilenae TaxID=1892865 RepID=A0A852ZYG9_9ACTN|nr:MarR family transcriptional regulator [Allostreptomyces psammosilenae]NYI03661.1 DNA-binding MarR family transcriptional regulator [Allostreptomyces psammosilenae]